MKDLGILNPEHATGAEASSFETRTAVRAVVYDRDGNVAVLHVTKQRYHKLPGGGVEDGEDEMMALKRECREELGCDIEVTGEVGQIIEYRKMLGLKQISPCYTARVVGEKGNPSFTQEESDEGFEIQWLPLDQALAAMTTGQPLNNEGLLYIVPRDRAFLEQVTNS